MAIYRSHQNNFWFLLVVEGFEWVFCACGRSFLFWIGLHINTCQCVEYMERFQVFSYIYSIQIHAWLTKTPISKNHNSALTQIIIHGFFLSPIFSPLSSLPFHNTDMLSTCVLCIYDPQLLNSSIKVTKQHASKKWFNRCIFAQICSK